MFLLALPPFLYLLRTRTFWRLRLYLPYLPLERESEVNFQNRRNTGWCNLVHPACLALSSHHHYLPYDLFILSFSSKVVIFEFEHSPFDFDGQSHSAELSLSYVDFIVAAISTSSSSSAIIAIAAIAAIATAAAVAITAETTPTGGAAGAGNTATAARGRIGGHDGTTCVAPRSVVCAPR